MSWRKRVRPKVKLNRDQGSGVRDQGSAEGSTGRGFIPPKNGNSCTFRILTIAVLLLIMGGVGSPLAALDPYWERKMVQGIEWLMVEPLVNINTISESTEEYNRFIEQMKTLPAWLEEPTDFEEIKEKIPSFERGLLVDLQLLNQEKIPSLGIFNTTWTSYFVEELNLGEVENILGRIRRSLNGKERDRTENICRSCVRELKELLDEAPTFTREFQATFPYARNREAVYRGNRLVAGLIEHYKDFRALHIHSLSADPQYSLRFAGHREIGGDVQVEPSYTFVLDSRPSSISPAWEALKVPSHPQGPKFAAYYSLEGFAGAGGLIESLTWALLAFDSPEAARAFWEGEKGFQRGDEREFFYLSLEKISWEGPKGRYRTWGTILGPYILLIAPRENQAPVGEEIDYLFGRVVRPY